MGLISIKSIANCDEYFSYNELADPIPGSNIYVQRGRYAVRARVRMLVGRSVQLFVNNPRSFAPD